MQTTCSVADYEIVVVFVAHITILPSTKQYGFCEYNSCHFLFVSARSFEFDMHCVGDITYAVDCVVEKVDYIVTILCCFVCACITLYEL